MSHSVVTSDAMHILTMCTLIQSEYIERKIGLNSFSALPVDKFLQRLLVNVSYVQVKQFLFQMCTNLQGCW